MRPVDREFHLRPPIPIAAAGDGQLPGRGGDDRYRRAAQGVGPSDPAPARRPVGLPDPVPARRPGGSHRSPTPRPGWYGYRVAGGAELPWWAVEVALTIERPASAAEAMAGLWHPVAPEPGGAGQALLLLRAPGRLRWLEGIAEAIAEVETLAGVRPAAPEGGLVEGGAGRAS